MAFFKFRLPGQQPAVTAEIDDGSGATLETVRRQARYRLVGAAVLVLVGVVVFPLIFDTQPRPVAVDTPIIVPDRHTAPSLSAALPPAQLPAAPLKPSVPDPGADASVSVAPEQPQTPRQAPGQVQSGPVEPAPAATSVAPSAERQSSPTAPPAPAKASAPAADSKPAADAALQQPRDDAARARALLEGTAGLKTADRHVLQVGAYTDPDKVREVRRKLEQAGFKTYTQAVEGQGGKRVVRVRIGPFDSKGDADKTAARVRQLGLPVSVLRL